ncbi:MAG: hypothetical protein RR219_05700 [Clostridiales bacterium]
MKKILICICISLVLLVGGCGNNKEEDHSSEIKVTVEHISSNEANKTINITYPVVGGIGDIRTLSSINSSIDNYVKTQEKEFNNALGEITKTEPIAKDFDTTVKKQIVAPKATTTQEENNSDTTTNADEENNGDTTTNADEENNSDTTTNTDEENNGDTTDNGTNTQNQDTELKGVVTGTDPITLKMTFDITYHSNNILNIMESYKKILGKGKAYIGQQSFAFDLDKGVPITLGDIYDFDSDFPVYVNDSINKQLKDNKRIQLYDDKSGFTGIRKDANFYLDEANGNIYIFYNALDISPEKTLIPTFEFSLKELSPYLLDTYSKKLNK